MTIIKIKEDVDNLKPLAGDEGLQLNRLTNGNGCYVLVLCPAITLIIQKTSMNCQRNLFMYVMDVGSQENKRQSQHIFLD